MIETIKFELVTSDRVLEALRGIRKGSEWNFHFLSELPADIPMLEKVKYLWFLKQCGEIEIRLVLDNLQDPAFHLSTIQVRSQNERSKTKEFLEQLPCGYRDVLSDLTGLVETKIERDEAGRLNLSTRNLAIQPAYMKPGERIRRYEEPAGIDAKQIRIETFLERHSNAQESLKETEERSCT